MHLYTTVKLRTSALVTSEMCATKGCISDNGVFGGADRHGRACIKHMHTHAQTTLRQCALGKQVVVVAAVCAWFVWPCLRTENMYIKALH
jgi:hypothetical protein